MLHLGISLDHVATLRQARRGREPDLLAAGHAALIGGADHVVVHLREDRRHVQERDVRLLREALDLPLHLAIAAMPALVAFAREVKPDHVCLVPERREEVTTEGGLDLAGHADPVGKAVGDLAAAGLACTLLVEPDEATLVAANGLGAEGVEIHTGRYARARTEPERVKAYLAVARGASSARSLGLRVHAGHGLDYRNVSRIAAIPDLEAVAVGFAVVARALFTGLEAAVAEMRERVTRARADEAPQP